MDPTDTLGDLQAWQQPSAPLLGPAITGAQPAMQMPANPAAQDANVSKWTGFFERLRTDPMLRQQLGAFFAGISAPSPGGMWGQLSQGANALVATQVQQAQPPAGGPTPWEMYKFSQTHGLAERAEERQNNQWQAGANRDMARMEWDKYVQGYREEKDMREGLAASQKESRMAANDLTALGRARQELQRRLDAINSRQTAGIPEFEEEKKADRRQALKEFAAQYKGSPEVLQMVHNVAGGELYFLPDGTAVALGEAFPHEGKCVRYVGLGYEEGELVAQLKLADEAACGKGAAPAAAPKKGMTGR